MSKIVLGSSAIVLLLALPALSLAVQPPPDVGEIALVLSSPWARDPAHVARDAGLQEISLDRALGGVFILLQTSEDLDRLYANGALIVLNGEAILALCSGTLGETT